MSKSSRAKRYAPEFRRQMIELVREDRTPQDLSKEFGCSIWSVRNWAKQGARDDGRGDGGLTTAERAEHQTLFGFVMSNQASYPVRLMCRLLGVSASGVIRGVRGPISR